MRSMTGYGSAEGRVGEGSLFIEIKSVNHRYYDIQLKLPPKMNPLDPMIRQVLKEHIDRGKVDIYMKERKGIFDSKSLSVDLPLARKYQKCVRELQKELGLGNKTVSVLELIDLKELVSVTETHVDYSKYWGQIKRLLTEALQKHDRMREKEGAFLLKDQRARLKNLSAMVEKIMKQSDSSLKHRRSKVEKKFEKNGLAQLPNGKERLGSELSYIIDKVDIAEELTRLKSHIVQFSSSIGEKGPQGRKLDFILQEMGREINTLGAKASDPVISSYVVDVKSELEKLREQVQNIE